jgi:hypothetical protein
MSNTNLLGSEEWAVVATTDPQSLAISPAQVYTDEIDMSLFEQIMVVVMTGALGTGATIDVKCQSATASGGTFADVTNKAITQLDDSPATDDDNTQAIINLRGDELTEGHRYVRVYVACGVAASLLSVVVLAKGKSLPSSDNDLGTVQEIVS